MSTLRYVLVAAGRMFALMLCAGFVHLLLVWLWNPRVAVGAAREVKIASELKSGPIVLAFGGDTALTDAALPTLKLHGYEHAVAKTLHLWRTADLAVVNLETVVSRHSTPFPLYKRYIYRMQPEALEALRWAGIDAVSLANNHIKDHDESGIVDTLGHVEKSGLIGFGAGRNVMEARRGVLLEVRGLKVGLLGYLEDSPMHSLYMQSFAWGGRPGCARLEFGPARRDIERLRQQADIVIVFLHWGRTYSGVTTVQELYGRFLIDSGADAVIGAHPHVHQPVALYKGKPIIYSLGNYTFGTEGRKWLRFALVARLYVEDKRLTRLELVPLAVQNRIVKFKPEPLSGDEARQMLAKLKRRSAAYGATLRLSADRAILEL